jgi:hypothetical protein
MIETYKGPDRWKITKADNFEEYLELAIKGEGIGRANGESNRASRHTGMQDWYGTSNWKETLVLVEKGWPEGRNRIGDIVSNIEAKDREIEKPTCVYDLEGDFVDVARFVQDEEKCMIKWSKRKIKRRVAKIYADIGGSAGVSAEALIWRGSCVLALIDKLEASGVRVELDMGRGMDSSWVEVIRVKEAAEPLYLDTLGFHLAHPSGFRRVLFSFEENQPEGQNHGCYQGHGYGCPTFDLSNALKDEGYDLIVPGFQLNDLDRAIKRVEEMFQTVCDAEKYHYGATG